MSNQEKEQWGSRLGVILAVAGSAVGLGNFLRFPGQVAQNGGGAFMIPYFCALLLLGIPIGWAEWTMGRYGGRKGFHSSPAIMGVFGKGSVARYFGVIGVLIPIAVYMYYVNIESWCLRYAWEYLIGGIDLGSDPAQYSAASARTFTEVTGADTNGVLLGGGLHPSVIFWAITFALNFFFVHRGLSRGIEKFCMWAMPTMAVCALIVLARVLTLGTPDPTHPERSVINGLGFMWNPDLSKLGDFKTWLAAAGQIFFTLSVGFGVIINYASYLKRKSDVVLSGLTASATNELFEVGFGGLITIPAAFIFLGASGAVVSTFGMGFNTLPVVFAHMGGFTRFIGGIWFFMLFLAAITSSLSMLQPVKAFFQEALGVSKRGATLLMLVIASVGSLWVIYFSKDLIALDTIDFWVGTTLVFVMAMIQIICFSWIFGVDRGIREAHEGAHFHIPRIYRFILKYVSPTYLLVVFIGFCVQQLPGYIKNVAAVPVATATMGLLGVTLLVLLVITRLGEKNWRSLGMDLDGTRPPEDVKESRP
jgi:SNF family Na+-dependent transporter